MSGPGESERVRTAWLAATRQELAAPAEAIERGSAALLAAVPDDAPAKFREAVANIHTRGRQMRELVAQFLGPGTDSLDEAQQRTMRHDTRGHAAYVIGMCDLWRRQAAKHGLERFLPALESLESAARHIVTLVERLVSFKSAAPTTAEELGVAEVLRSVEELPASLERGDILVVDDNPYHRQLLADLLVNQGHRVASASDADEALRQLESKPFDLILLDVLMPGVTGFTFLERLKASPRWRHIPVVLMSALEDQRSIAGGIARGAEDYLTRPIDPLLLRARIASSLEKKRLRDREITYLDRIDQLLHAIFPGPVVTELKETNTVRPRRHDKVGVLFIDVAGFTAFCDARRDRPEEVVESLQRHYLAFERIARAHGVQKIKTIGDAFMATAGLLKPHDNPALSLVRCGLDMIAAARTNTPSWDVRVGVHIGPVVAGVVGETQFSFDLWGDTVNTAARMESAGTPGAVTLSPEAWHELRDLGTAEPRQVEVRGKGPMEVFRFMGFKS
jgi:class 3 adenylate cyclase